MDRKRGGGLVVCRGKKKKEKKGETEREEETVGETKQGVERDHGVTRLEPG